MTDRTSRALNLLLLPVMAMLLLLSSGGCATIRVTDTPRTATEQFLLSVAVTEAIEELSTNALRDRTVYIEPRYLRGVPDQETSFLLGELRAKLLLSGVRLVEDRAAAQMVLEVRTGGVGVDRTEFLLGIPALYMPTVSGATGSAEVPLATPELAIIKRTRQRGFAGVAFVAYWADTGELVASSGPFVGETMRQDYWFFGTGPRTVGDIPTAQPPR